MSFKFDTITIICIVIVFVVLVFLLADYRVFKNYIRQEKDRNISFTSQQVKDYMKTYSSTNMISEEFVKEFLEDVIKENLSPEEGLNENIEE